eukprot:CFRG2620T1
MSDMKSRASMYMPTISLTDETCHSCLKTVYAMEKMKFETMCFHKWCFKCAKCNSVMAVVKAVKFNGDVYCDRHFDCSTIGTTGDHPLRLTSPYTRRRQSQSILLSCKPANFGSSRLNQSEPTHKHTCAISMESNGCDDHLSGVEISIESNIHSCNADTSVCTPARRHTDTSTQTLTPIYTTVESIRRHTEEHKQFLSSPYTTTCTQESDGAQSHTKNNYSNRTDASMSEQIHTTTNMNIRAAKSDTGSATELDSTLPLLKLEGPLTASISKPTPTSTSIPTTSQLTSLYSSRTTSGNSLKSVVSVASGDESEPVSRSDSTNSNDYAFSLPHVIDLNSDGDDSSHEIYIDADEIVAEIQRAQTKQRMSQILKDINDGEQSPSNRLTSSFRKRMGMQADIRESERKSYEMALKDDGGTQSGVVSNLLKNLMACKMVDSQSGDEYECNDLLTQKKLQSEIGELDTMLASVASEINAVGRTAVQNNVGEIVPPLDKDENDSDCDVLIQASSNGFLKAVADPNSLRTPSRTRSLLLSHETLMNTMDAEEAAYACESERIDDVCREIVDTHTQKDIPVHFQKVTTLGHKFGAHTPEEGLSISKLSAVTSTPSLIVDNGCDSEASLSASEGERSTCALVVTPTHFASKLSRTHQPNSSTGTCEGGAIAASTGTSIGHVRKDKKGGSSSIQRLKSTSESDLSTLSLSAITPLSLGSRRPKPTPLPTFNPTPRKAKRTSALEGAREGFQSLTQKQIRMFKCTESENTVEDAICDATRKALVEVSDDFVVEPSTVAHVAKGDNYHLDLHNNTGFYQSYFFSKEHINYFAVDQYLGKLIISIRKERVRSNDPNMKDIQYRVCFRSEMSEDENLVIPDTWVKGWKKSKRGSMASIAKVSIKDVINFAFPRLELLTKLTAPASEKEAFDANLAMLSLDKDELIKTYKFGLMYCKEGQTTENEMFANEHGSKNYNDFLNLIGSKVRLNGFKSFRGGLDVKDDTTGEYSVFTFWNDVEIMLHVSTLLPYQSDNEQQLFRKAHIGNDIVVVVYVEGEGTFNPASLVAQFPHVFIVVRLEREVPTKRYRVEVASRTGVPEFLPHVTHYFEHDCALRDFLLTKMINGEHASYKAPKFRKMRQRTRRLLLNNLFDEFMPNLSK